MAAGMERKNEPSETIEPEENHTQSQLPEELWEQILSKLTLKDNICASAVSKRFLSIATSVQKANKPPWLLIPPKSGDSYKLYDPSKRKSYSLEFPELRGAKFVHSKDGWLLMSNTENLILFLFCPYTRELIQFPEFPNLSLGDISVCFSAAPTSPECMVFSIHATHENHGLQTIQIFTCRPGETRWTNVNYHYDEWKFSPFKWDKMLFCNGLFYYFNSVAKAMGIYNPGDGSWSVEDIPRPEVIEEMYLSDRIVTKGYWRNVFMEHDGEIFITHTSKNKNPVIYKFDRPNHKLVELETLGGRSLFISYLSSHIRTGLLGNERNNIYLPKVQSDGERCISYCFDKGKYDWTDLDRFESFWIDAPNEDLSTVL